MFVTHLIKTAHYLIVEGIPTVPVGQVPETVEALFWQLTENGRDICISVQVLTCVFTIICDICDKSSSEKEQKEKPRSPYISRISRLFLLAGAERLGLACRLGRRFCFAEVSTGDPRPSARGFGEKI